MGVQGPREATCHADHLDYAADMVRNVRSVCDGQHGSIGTLWSKKQAAWADTEHVVALQDPLSPSEIATARHPTSKPSHNRDKAGCNFTPRCLSCSHHVQAPSHGGEKGRRRAVLHYPSPHPSKRANEQAVIIQRDKSRHVTAASHSAQGWQSEFRLSVDALQHVLRQTRSRSDDDTVGNAVRSA